MVEKINLFNLEMKIRKIIPDSWHSVTTINKINLWQLLSFVLVIIKVSPENPDEVFAEINSGINLSKIGPQTKGMLAKKDVNWYLEDEILFYLIPSQPVEQFVEQFPNLIKQINERITMVDETLQNADRKTALILSKLI